MKIRHAALALTGAATLLLGAANPALAGPSTRKLNQVAVDFVKLTLEAGQREDGYVDAYYGPKVLAEAAKAHPREVKALRKEADRLRPPSPPCRPRACRPTRSVARRS
jgi:hypothetical protein